MNKLILTVGISGSGKSTFAGRTVQHNPDRYIRVSRDKLREMLYGYTEASVNEYYQRNDMHKLEGWVTSIEHDMIEGLLTDEDTTVIVDETHLKAKYLNNYSKYAENGIEIELVFFNITLKEALIRNKSRVRQVDEDIIIRQYDNYVNLRKFLTSGKLKFDYICTEINN